MTKPSVPAKMNIWHSMGATNAQDPNAPKQNKSAYLIYTLHIMPYLRRETPEASFHQISNEMFARFNQFTGDERAEYEQLAAEDKTRYEREMKVYRGLQAQLPSYCKRAKQTRNSLCWIKKKDDWKKYISFTAQEIADIYAVS